MDEGHWQGGVRTVLHWQNREGAQDQGVCRAGARCTDRVIECVCVGEPRTGIAEGL